MYIKNVNLWKDLGGVFHQLKLLLFRKYPIDTKNIRYVWDEVNWIVHVYLSCTLTLIIFWNEDIGLELI